MARVQAAEAYGFKQGYRRGYQHGDAAGYARSEQQWDTAFRPAKDWVRAALRTPSARRLELLRWGPGGSAATGQPRPGDYTGGPVAPW
jgi:hypothetical protein